MFDTKHKCQNIVTLINVEVTIRIYSITLNFLYTKDEYLYWIGISLRDVKF